MVKPGDRVRHQNDIDDGKNDIGTVLDCHGYRTQVRWDSDPKRPQLNITSNLVLETAAAQYAAADYVEYYEAITE